MNRLKSMLLSLLRKWKEYKDKKFAERIERIYFHCNYDGNRYIKGRLHAVYDEDFNAIKIIDQFTDTKWAKPYSNQIIFK